MPILACQNPAHPGCPGPLKAHYKHDHGSGQQAKEWDRDPAEGPTPTGAPHPQPCPDDGVMCGAESVTCKTCGWTKALP
jgi:hypothetical protein